MYALAYRFAAALFVTLGNAVAVPSFGENVYMHVAFAISECICMGLRINGAAFLAMDNAAHKHCRPIRKL